jgi:SAM-dependent methyltransferase
VAENRTPFERQLGKDPDGRLDAPAFHRNFEPMLAVLQSRLGDRSGHVLEIGSGTGQHAAGFARAFPDLTWWPSDVVPRNLASIEAWRKASGGGNERPALALDVADPALHLEGEDMPPAGALTAVVSMNVIHIAPWAVCEGIMRIAGRDLAPGGLLILYGPFKRDGRHTAPSNEAFDASLRREDPEWGVRDLGEVEKAAKGQGLRLVEVIEMPANNLTLVFQCDPGTGGS